MLYSKTSASYGSGLLVSYYDDGISQVLCTGGTVTIEKLALNSTIEFYHTSETITDCNTYKKGIGRIIDSTANRPFNYGILNTYIHSNTGYITQTAVSVANPTKMAYRSSGDGGTTWVAWYVVNDQIDALNSNINTLNTVGFNVNTTNVDTNSLFIRKLNMTYGVVTINGYIMLKNAATSSVEIGTIAQGSRPANAVRGVCAFADYAYEAPASIGYVTISTAGVLSITPQSNNNKKAVYFSLSYHAQN